MLKYMTEKKSQTYQDSFKTPQKSKKPKLSTLPQNQENVFDSPFTKKLKKNLSSAYTLSETIISNIDKFQIKLKEAKKKLNKNTIKTEDILESHFKEIENRDLKNYKVSPIKFETASKNKGRSEFFYSMQRIKKLSKDFLGFENFCDFQNKCFEKFLLRFNLLISSGPFSGKSSIFVLYVKFLVEKNKDLRVLYICGKKKIWKVGKYLKCLKIEKDVEVVSEIGFEERKSEQFDLVVIDNINFKLEKILRISKFLNLQKKVQFLISSLWKDEQVIKLSSFFKIPQNNLILKNTFTHFKNKTTNLSFSYEEDGLRSLTKFIKTKIDEAKQIKFNFKKNNKLSFCVVTNNKEEKEKLIDYLHDNKISFLNPKQSLTTSQKNSKNPEFKSQKNSNFPDQKISKNGPNNYNQKNSNISGCYIADSIYDIDSTPNYIMILNFNYIVKDLIFLEAYHQTNIHIFLSKKNLFLARNRKLFNMTNAFVFNDILNCFREQKNDLNKITFLIDFYEKKFNFYNYENFIEYLISYNYVDLEEYCEKKRVNVFYIKSTEEMKKVICRNKKLKKLEKITERKNYLILNKNDFKELEPELLKLKKEANLNFSTYIVKEYIFKSTNRLIKKMKKNFMQIISGFNQLQKKKLYKIDLLYSELKNRGFGNFTRSNQNGKLEFEKIRKILEDIFFEKSDKIPFLDKIKNSDLLKSLPYKQNFKKQDILMDFTKIYNENLGKINRSTFYLKKQSESEIFETVNLEIIKQIFLELKWKYSIGQNVISKIKKYDFIKLLNLLNKNIQILKK